MPSFAHINDTNQGKQLPSSIRETLPVYSQRDDPKDPYDLTPISPVQLVILGWASARCDQHDMIVHDHSQNTRCKPPAKLSLFPSHISLPSSPPE